MAWKTVHAHTHICTCRTSTAIARSLLHNIRTMMIREYHAWVYSEQLLWVHIHYAEQLLWSSPGVCVLPHTCPYAPCHAECMLASLCLFTLLPGPLAWLPSPYPAQPISTWPLGDSCEPTDPFPMQRALWGSRLAIGICEDRLKMVEMMEKRIVAHHDRNRRAQRVTQWACIEAPLTH